MFIDLREKGREKDILERKSDRDILERETEKEKERKRDITSL